MQECGVIAAGMSMIYVRFKQMDFLHGFMDGSGVIVIPKPSIANENIDAIIKPFQFWVLAHHFLFSVLYLNVVVFVHVHGRFG